MFYDFIKIRIEKAVVAFVSWILHSVTSVGLLRRKCFRSETIFNKQ